MSDFESTRQYLQRYAPSVFATEPYEKMSDKYRFIPTIDVVEKLLENGFIPAKASENRVRTKGKAGFAKHAIRFRHSNMLPQVGEHVPEIILVNSHDGSSAFQISAGIYRLVCKNGLTVGSDHMSVRTRHSGDIGDVIDGVFQVVEEFPEVVRSFHEWQGITLTTDQQLAFARAARSLRWESDEGHNYPIHEGRLLQPRRPEDASKDLWSTFNVVQENIIKGGMFARGSDGRSRRARPVKSVNEDQRLNKALWILAAELAKQL